MLFGQDQLDRFRRAEFLYEASRPAEAALLLEELLQEEPDRASLVELLARSYYASAQLMKAEEAFRRLLELSPTSTWAWRALGRTLERQSRYVEAVTCHRMADALGE